MKMFNINMQALKTVKEMINTKPEAVKGGENVSK